MDEKVFIKRNKNVILIYVDQKRRDLIPLKLIKYYLELLGLKVVLCSFVDFFDKYLYYRPKAVLQAHPDIYHGEWTKFMSNFSLVFALPTEQVITDKTDYVKRLTEGHNIANKAFEKPCYEYIYKAFISGKQHIEYLKNTQIASKALHTGFVGVVGVDFEVKKKQKRKVTIGFGWEDGCSFENITELIFRTLHMDNIIYNIPSYLSYNIQVIRVMLEIIERLYTIDDVEIEIIIRPRLSKMDLFDHIKTIYNNIVIDVNDSPYEFFEKIDLIIVAQSTIGMDAQMNGVPAITINGLLKEYLEVLNILEEEKLHYHWDLHSYDQIKDYIQHVKNGTMQISPKVELFQQFRESFFNPPIQNKSAHEIIADAIYAGIVNFENIDLKETSNNQYINFEHFDKLLRSKVKKIPYLSKVLYRSFMSHSRIGQIVIDLYFWLERFKLYVKIVVLKRKYEQYLDLYDNDDELYKVLEMYGIRNTK